MQFGLNFFPSVGPADMSAEQHYRECMELIALGDSLGYAHVRQVEHHFHPYGGYSPNPVVFLAAAAQQSRNMRVMTAAVLPAFNNPLKLAGELAMLDGISGGRLDIGFARAFVPHEFEHFGIDMDESRARFVEGVAQITQLLHHERVTSQGKFHSYNDVTTYPRLTQANPPVWIAGTSSAETFEMAAREGYNIMFFGMPPARIKPFLELYRETWLASGHPGTGKAMVSFALACAPTRDEAMRVLEPAYMHHKNCMMDSVEGWFAGKSSTDYPGYAEMLAKMKSATFEQEFAEGIILAGTPDDIVGQVESYMERAGTIELVSLSGTTGTMPAEFSKKSIQLFAEKVMPRLAQL